MRRESTHNNLPVINVRRRSKIFLEILDKNLGEDYNDMQRKLKIFLELLEDNLHEGNGDM